MNDVVRAFLEREKHLRVVDRLGVGGFAEAWKVKTSSGVQSVVKVSLQPINEKNPALKKELENLNLVKAISGYPHLVSLLDYWVVADYLLTRWELAGGGDLLRLWERYRQQGQPGIPVAKLIPLIRDAADGLDFLHVKGIYHRDVKPQNLLLFQGRVKVGDLGLRWPRTGRLLYESPLYVKCVGGACLRAARWSHSSIRASSRGASRVAQVGGFEMAKTAPSILLAR